MADSIFSCVDEDAQELEAQQSGDDGYLASPVSLSLDGSEDGGGAGVPLEAEALEALADAAPEPDVPGPDRAARSLPWYKQDCSVTPPIFGRAAKGGKGGKGGKGASSLRTVTADMGATVFYGESWVQAVRKKEVSAHWYFITSDNLILATTMNTCVNFNRGQCTRSRCSKFHAALGDLLDVLPGCRVKSPTVVSRASDLQARNRCLYVDGGGYLLKWSAVDMAQINESLRVEEEGDQQEMRRLLAQREKRVRAESFRQQLVELQASEAAALQRGRAGPLAIQVAPQPQQLLLGFAQARVPERAVPEPPAIGDFDADELRSATLRRKLAAAKLAAKEFEAQ